MNANGRVKKDNVCNSKVNREKMCPIWKFFRKKLARNGEIMQLMYLF